MINTFYGLGTLDSTAAAIVALLIGFFFGLALERAGFGSSRRLAGIFYFKDMAVFKVMFTALVTAMLGLGLLTRLGYIDPSTQIYHMPTYYGAYIVAGLLFGVGFVMAGWCPGTAAVGLASGKIDAAVFLGGAILGSIFYNEVFPLIKPLAVWGASAQTHFGQASLAFLLVNLGLSQSGLMLLITLVAVGGFWGCQILERRRTDGGTGLQGTAHQRLLAVSVGLPLLALLVAVMPSMPPGQSRATPVVATVTPETPAFVDPAVAAKQLLAHVDRAGDHVEPETLADLLMGQDAGVVAVDVRSAQEYAAFHIRGARHVPLADLPAFAAANRDKRMIVLYSNGMTHPAQARDALSRLGYTNVYLLTDGLTGFREYCLKPVSLRDTPGTAEMAAKINAWRDFFLAVASGAGDAQAAPAGIDTLPGLITTDWLAKHLTHPALKIIDCRDQPDYNRGHLPGAIAVNPEHVRGVVDGVPSVLLPATVLAAKLSLMNIDPGDTVVVVYGGDRVRDATLIGMAFERLGHKRWGILDGGFDKWRSEQRELTFDLPPAGRGHYPPAGGNDDFSLAYGRVLQHVEQKSARILDVRPSDYFTGQKSDEARAGHIPGALNRDFKRDLTTGGTFTTFLPPAELKAAYATLLGNDTSPVIVHCRTGHQASQTFFVLKYLLGYAPVWWYDAGWSEWAARPELPVAR